MLRWATWGQYFAVCFLIARLAVPAVAQDHVLAGTFQTISLGDYAHLQVVDDRGLERSFFVGRDPSFKPFVEHPEKYAGCRVRVRWHRVQRYIPEAGSRMTIDEAISIEMLTVPDLKAFDGTVVTVSWGSRIGTCVVRARDGRERQFYITKARLPASGLRSGTSVRVVYRVTGDDPEHALEVKLR